MLEDYPVVIEVPVAWGEMDSFHHVNNAVYFRYFESARIEYFERIDFNRIMKETGIGPILGSTNCRFRIPLTYPDTVQIGAKVDQVDADRFVMKYRVVSKNHGKIAAEGEGLLVSFDYKKGIKTALPDIVRENIAKLEA